MEMLGLNFFGQKFDFSGHRIALDQLLIWIQSVNSIDERNRFTGS
jgi:hypothetical protein